MITLRTYNGTQLEAEWLEQENIDISGSLLSIPAPSGSLDPNYTPPDRTSLVLCTCIISFIVAAAFAFGRLFSRRSVLGNFFLSDISLLVSLVFTGIFTVIQCLGASYGGWGKHIYDLQPKTVVTGFKFVFFHQITYPLTVYFTTLSILLFFLRMGPGLWMKKFIFGMMAYTTALTLVAEFAAIFQCLPVAAAWDLPLRVLTTPAERLTEPAVKEHGLAATMYGNCVNIAAMWYSLSVMHVIGDASMVVMPIEMAWRVRETAGLGRTLKVACLFALGTLVCAVAVARVVYLRVVLDGFDFTWDNVGTVLCAQYECTLGIICICLPSLRPVARIAVAGTFHSAVKQNPRTWNGWSHTKSKSKPATGVSRWTLDFKLRSTDMSSKDSRINHGDTPKDELEKEYPGDPLFCNFQLRQDPVKGDVEMGIRMELGDLDTDSTVSKPRKAHGKGDSKWPIEVGEVDIPSEGDLEKQTCAAWEQVVMYPKPKKRTHSPGGNTFGVRTPLERSAASSRVSIPQLAVLHNHPYSPVTVFPTENSVRIQRERSSGTAPTMASIQRSDNRENISHLEDDSGPEDEDTDTEPHLPRPQAYDEPSQVRPTSMPSVLTLPLQCPSRSSSTRQPSISQTQHPHQSLPVSFPASSNGYPHSSCYQHTQQPQAQPRKNSTTSQLTSFTVESESRWVCEEIEEYWEFLDHSVSCDTTRPPDIASARHNINDNRDSMLSNVEGTGGFAQRRWTTSFGDEDDKEGS